ncbi:hypothetical protein EKO23_10275 [Nocardioides guangzhouensis]|uniref:Cobyrinic acid a,c-diamide synthase n=1 Tax=Nocardioides guangzhouensis TaxID=2497878 RepID=A0A4V1XZ99_9ACTN|nr:hypothetical protein [Nocardioides guangzhouensis]RYP86009.1 hypothetical protein EKO23_10275 [Nocardioides guangzhouensis]
MSRRVSLPTADELFRPTARRHDGGSGPRPVERPVEVAVAEPETGDAGATAKRPSGRVRHDEKMTVYITSDELMDLEHARLLLRRRHGLAVDRGRVVREAISIALADFELNGDDSVIVQRLRDH